MVVYLETYRDEYVYTIIDEPDNLVLFAKEVTRSLFDIKSFSDVVSDISFLGEDNLIVFTLEDVALYQSKTKQYKAWAQLEEGSNVPDIVRNDEPLKRNELVIVTRKYKGINTRKAKNKSLKSRGI